jgi:hypothetical protein
MTAAYRNQRPTIANNRQTVGWDLAEQSKRCASMPKVADSNPSGGSESPLTF